MVRPEAKVTVDSLQEVVYEKSIGTEMNDLDLCFERCIKGMSTIASQSPLFNYRYSENVSDRCLVP